MNASLKRRLSEFRAEDPHWLTTLACFVDIDDLWRSRNWD